MRRGLVALAAVIVVAAWAVGRTAPAQDQVLPEDFRRSNGNMRIDAPTAAPSIHGRQPRGATTGTPVIVVPQPYYGGTPYYNYRPVYPSYGGYYGPGYYPYYRPVYPYPRYGYGYMLPPVYIPAERLYGPQAVQRFMGVR